MPHQKSRPLQTLPSPVPLGSGNGNEGSLNQVTLQAAGNACMAEIQKVLDAYNFEFFHYPTLTQEGRIVSVLQLRPRQERG